MRREDKCYELPDGDFGSDPYPGERHQSISIRCQDAKLVHIGRI